MLTENVVKTILEAETNSTRFEQFCADICSATEGIAFVTTSATYDRGRDARSAGRARGSHAAVVCATLNEGIDTKVEKDLERVGATTDPDRLIYCSSQDLSEHAADKLMAIIRGHIKPPTSAAVYGSQQLAQFSVQKGEIFQRHYGAELQNFIDWLQPHADGEEESVTRGVRLALLTFGGEEGGNLRESASRRAVLDTLNALTSATGAQLAKALSDNLRLPRALSPAFIDDVLRRLLESGLVRTENGSGWSLTDQGRADVAAVPPQATRELLEGRHVIREQIETLIGQRLADDHFERVWTIFLDFLGALFYSNGVGVVEGVRDLLNGTGSEGGAGLKLQSLLRSGASKIRATSSNDELGEALEQAVLDIFTEREGRAFDWLGKIAERFVILCSMGLENTSADEIRKLLQDQLVVLDSDIILTFLNAAEPDHDAAVELLRRFRRLGGHLLVVTPILEEVAHHAWIAEHDFEQTRHFGARLHSSERRRYARNAFTRTFFGHAGANTRNWSAYIDQYRGTRSDDYSHILEILKDELGVDRLSDTYDAALRKSAGTRIAEMLASSRGVSVRELEQRDHDKANRDGQVVATIAAARRAHRSSGSRKTVLLLTSSTRLRRADEIFRTELGSPHAVVSIGSFAYLLSLLPGAELGAGALRRALFEFGESARLTDADGLALRVIRASDQFSFPWSRRRALHRALETVLHREARARAVGYEKFVQRFEAGDEGVKPAEMIAEALAQVAVSDKTTQRARDAERLVHSQQAEIAALKEQIRQLRGSRTPGRSDESAGRGTGEPRRRSD